MRGLPGWVKAASPAWVAAAILVAGVIPLVFVGVTAYRSAAGSLRRDTESRLDDAAVTTGRQIDRLLFERYGDVQALAESQAATSRRLSGIDDLMATASRSYAPAYRLMVVAGRGGRVLAAYSRVAPAAAAALAGQNVSRDGWFRAALRSPIAVTGGAADPLVKAVGGGRAGYGIEFSAAIHDATGRVDGVWADFVSWSVLEHLLSASADATREPSLHLFLLDRDDAVIASDLPRGRFLTRLPSGSGLASVLGAGSSAVSVPASTFVADASGSDLAAAAHEAGYSSYRGLGWTTLAVQDRRSAFAAADSLQRQMWEIGLGGAALLLAAALLVAAMLGRALAARAGLEHRLRQSYKLQAVGQLAGGVAHDFNNLLTVISGNAQLALHPSRGVEAARRNVREIVHAVERASDLVRQLLVFSRVEPENVRVVDLNAEVEDLLRVLPRLIPSNIAIEGEPAGVPAPVRIDPTQLEQVALNLAVNARDAMPDGGVLRLAVDVVGETVRLRVADTGVGMDAAMQDRIFEPFFTTKEVGAGTGLGLATVYGIVTHAGGTVSVESAPGAGATFTVELPLAELGPEEASGTDQAIPVRGRDERILFAEDDEPVRAFGAELLVRAGYEVVAVADGAEALEVLTADPGFDLVVSDVMMPRLTGLQLLSELRARGSRIPVLFVSGYPSESDDAFDPRSRMVAKPYTIRALTAAIRELLAAAAEDDDPAAGRL